MHHGWISGNLICNQNEFPCPGEDIDCIPVKWACDGVADCSGGEDEESQTCGNIVHYSNVELNQFTNPAYQRFCS